MWSAKAGGAASVEPRPDGSPAVPQYYQGGGAVPEEFHEMPHSEGASETFSAAFSACPGCESC